MILPLDLGPASDVLLCLTHLVPRDRDARVVPRVSQHDRQLLPRRRSACSEEVAELQGRAGLQQGHGGRVPARADVDHVVVDSHAVVFPVRRQGKWSGS